MSIPGDIAKGVGGVAKGAKGVAEDVLPFPNAITGHANEIVGAKPPRKGSYGSDGLTQLAHWAGIRDPGSQRIAAAIAMAESGGRTNAHGTNTDGSIDRGLWQINNKAHPDVSDQCAYDPFCNAKAMVKISSGGTDWGAWTTYKSGAYKKYLRKGSPALAAADLTQSGLHAATDWASALTKVLSWITSPHNWLRIGEILLGGIALIVAAVTVGRAMGLPTSPVESAIKNVY